MHFSTGTLTALALGLVAVDAHMLMDSPVPMNKDNLDNGPLAADGSDYPCKQRPGVYDDDGANAPMALGSTQQLSFTGSAVHGGGSCQISISYDLEPTADSDFRVIHSIVGGCPAAVDGNLPENPNGNGASTFDFQIPADLPTGKATLAWTWFNRIGNREMYMNCARVVIGGGGGGGGGADASAKLRRRESRPILRRDQSAFEALPVMFKANINNGCTTVESTDLEFPDPGASVERAGSGSTGPPTGSCAAGSTGSTPPTSGGNGGGGGGGGGDDSSQPAPSSASSSASAAVPTNTGGSFNEVPVSSPLSSPTPAAPVPATPDNEAPPPPPAASSSSSPSPSPSPSPSSSPDAPSSNSTEAQSGSCTPEGQFTCVGADSFQQCGSGRWSPVMPMAAGTVCETQALGIKVARSSTKAKRHLRFSHGHLRHHDSV